MENSILAIKSKPPTPFMKAPQSHHKTPFKFKPNNPKTTQHHQPQLSHNINLQEAISALENGSRIRPKTFISLLQSCIDSDSISNGRKLHSSVNSLTEPNPFVQTKLISMYAKCGCLNDARDVFDKMQNRNLYAWSAIINGYSREKRWGDVVDLFFDMMNEGFVPDAFLLPKILQACSNAADFETGRLLHSIAVRCGFLDSNEETHVRNSVLAMYAKCGELVSAEKFFEKLEVKNRVSWNAIISGHCQFGENEEAIRLFQRMAEEKVEPGLVTWNILISGYSQLGNSERVVELMKQMESSGISPDVVTWTSLISGFVQNSKTMQALDLFQEMILSEIKPNGMTIASVVSACADLRYLKKGKEMHSYAVKIGMESNLLVANALVDMYAKSGMLEDAERVFEGILEKDVYTWNSMIGGYAQAGYCSKAYDLFSKMESLGVHRNVVTWNVMMSGYIQNGDEHQAMELFQRMERDGIKRNAGSWNTLISGSLENGSVDKALSIFRKMQSNLVRPNSITILSILPAFANLVSVSKIKEIHTSILHNGLQSETSITNALISTYSNAGNLKTAQILFNRLKPKDLISWNSIISGCFLHGFSRLARDLFSQMKEQGVKPNQTTFTSITRAYSLDLMVKEGTDLFTSMIDEYQLSPGLENYTAMVELLCRAARLGEALEFIENMPLQPDSTIWNAVLSAARIHGNAKIVSLAAHHLLRLDPNNTRIQKILSKVTKPIRESSSTSVSHGCCWIEFRNNIHTFYNGQRLTIELETKLNELNEMVEESRTSPMYRFFPGSKFDIEELEENGGVHSEKIAIAFSLINISNFRSIRVIKSVDMCEECHTIAKLVSKVHQREILIKDTKGLHRFRDGKCSCRDCW